MLDCDDCDDLARVHRHLIDTALAQPQVLVHRDFMPRNLMPADDGPAVLDFQDAVRGPVAYDALSLFKDAFLSWPRGTRRRLAGRATTRAPPMPACRCRRANASAATPTSSACIAISRYSASSRACAIATTSRNTWPTRRASSPTSTSVLPKYPELMPLATILDRHVRPVLADGAPA